ncbi:acetyl-CoA acetyltransferase [Bradyrhizobium sp. i1.3.6]
MTASIVGWAHTPFGKFDTETVESLVTRVANEAMADAGISASDVDEIVLGHFNAGFSPQDFTASLVLQADPKLRFKPTTRVENACATGSAAVHQGLRAIDAGAARIVLVVGVEQMTRTPGSGDRQEPAQGVLSAGGRGHRRRLRRRVRQDRQLLFPEIR